MKENENLGQWFLNGMAAAPHTFYKGKTNVYIVPSLRSFIWHLQKKTSDGAAPFLFVQLCPFLGDLRSSRSLLGENHVDYHGKSCLSMERKSLAFNSCLFVKGNKIPVFMVLLLDRIGF
jgi:hypothetical protein